MAAPLVAPLAGRNAAILRNNLHSRRARGSWPFRADGQWVGRTLSQVASGAVSLSAKKNRRAKRKNGGVSAHQPTRSKVTSTRTLLSRKRDSVPKAHGVVKRQSGPLLTAEQKREPDVSACLAVRSTVSRIRLCDEDPGKNHCSRSSPYSESSESVERSTKS